MKKQSLQDTINALPVYDTHTHLKGDSLPAKNFWDIGHYFWFIRELQAAGYPTDPMSLRPAQRIKAFWAAYQATSNTSMNWVVRRILSDLYNIDLKSEADIRTADEAIRTSASDPAWAAAVCEKTHIRRIYTNVPADAPFEGLPGVAGVLPRMEGTIRGWIERIRLAGDQTTECDAVGHDIDTHLAGYAQAGYRGIMTSEDPFDRIRARTHNPSPLVRTDNSIDAIGVAVLHKLCEAATRHNLFIQLFLGIEKGWGTMEGGGGVPAYQGDRILNLHGLFERYPIPFELVLGDGIGNSDAVNAARIFPNVHVGGMWWYNFRASTYRQTMQQRFEALPSTKSELVVSDARCIEWCYGKIVLIKRLLGDFLADQVDQGWVDSEGALLVAQNWLHDSAETLYK
jgi:hypothetical protein